VIAPAFVFLFDELFLFLFLGREPGDGPSQRVATIIMLICAGWLPQDNQIDRGAASV
jgi:hypothetical protein